MSVLACSGTRRSTCTSNSSYSTRQRTKSSGPDLVGHGRLHDLLSCSLFVVSTSGNDFRTFDDCGVPMSDMPAFTTGMVAGHIKYNSVCEQKCIDRMSILMSVHTHDGLYKLGARQLAVLDILPVGCLSSQRAIMANSDCNTDGDTLSRMFNAILWTEMSNNVVATSMLGLRYSIPALAGKLKQPTF
jgi:hypothetical protein